MEDPKPKSRGQRLAAARKFIGWSQRDVARHLEIGQTTVSFAENDSDRVTPVYWRVLVDFCDKVDARIIRAEDKPATTEGTTA